MSATVQTTSGPVRGSESGGVHRFLGIPFAAAPVGDRWLMPPVPPEPWTGVRDAQELGPTAPQALYPFAIEPLRPGDDYLNVNVWTPSLEGGAVRPVLVWIHGGGSVIGSNNIDCSAFARDGIVAVALNYRLGIEGFGAVDGAPLNRAVHDWLVGLQWVQDNVAAFGGDPTQVTIMGQSAGSAAVLSLLSIDAARGLFHRVIAMSGAPHNTPTIGHATAFMTRVCAELGVERTREGLASVDPQLLLDVQAKHAPVGPKLDAGIEEAWRSMSHDPVALGVVVGDDLVAVAPEVAMGEGAGGDVALMIGTTAEEADALRLMGMHLDLEAVKTMLGQAGVGPGAVDAYVVAHAASSPPEVLGRAITDIGFRVPTVRLAERRLAAGAAAPTYVYEFAWAPPDALGAAHTIDLPFVFDTLADSGGFAMLIGSDPPQALATETHAAFARFVLTGNPGWAPYDVTSRPVMVFDTPSSVMTDPHAAALAAFGGLR